MVALGHRLPRRGCVPSRHATNGRSREGGSPSTQCGRAHSRVLTRRTGGPPVIVGSAVEDREKVEAAPWLERLSVTEVVREARAAASQVSPDCFIFGVSDRKDEHAILRERTRSRRAPRDFVP